MMPPTLSLLLEAASRSLLLGCMAWLLLTGCRAKNPLTHLLVWKGVLFVSIAMPLLVIAKQQWAPQFPSVSIPVPILFGSGFVDPAGAATVSTVIEGKSSYWPTVTVALYIVVALLLLTRMAIGLARGWTLRRRAMPLGNGLFLSPAVDAPMVFGTAIILPTEFDVWADDKRDAVLAHERAHVIRGDFELQLLATVYRAIFWFNPLSWWICHQLAAVAELASDDAAVEVHGDRLSYARILMEVACEAQPPGGVVAMARGPTVSLRIARLASTAPSATPLAWGKQAVIDGIGIALALGVLITTPVEWIRDRPSLAAYMPGNGLPVEHYEPILQGIGPFKHGDRNVAYDLPAPKLALDSESVGGGYDVSIGAPPPAPVAEEVAVSVLPPVATESPATSLDTQAVPMVPSPPLANMANRSSSETNVEARGGYQLVAMTKSQAEAAKKAERARKIAEREMREARNYTPLGSHIRGVEATGGTVEVARSVGFGRKDQPMLNVYP